MESTHNEISPRHKRNSIYIIFHCRQNEMNFCLKAGPKKMAHLVKAKYFYFDEINACADVSSLMVPFQVAFNILSPEMKFYFCQNDRNEITPAMSFIPGDIIYTGIKN